MSDYYELVHEHANPPFRPTPRLRAQPRRRDLDRSAAGGLTVDGIILVGAAAIILVAHLALMVLAV